MKQQNILLFFSLTGIAGSVLLLIPPLRFSFMTLMQNSKIYSLIYSKISSFIEIYIIHRSLNPERINEHWNNVLFVFACNLLLLSLIILFFSFPRFIKLYKYLRKTFRIDSLIQIKPPELCVRIWNSRLFIGVFCALLGALFFVCVFGTAILDFSYTDWLMSGGDLSQHYTGWCFFRNSAWYFPFGLMDNIVYPFKESIIYTDSIPLFALVFKLLSPLLPEHFQYFGLFGILIYTLQGAIAGLIVKKISNNTVYSIIGSLFFVFSTTMMQRIYFHTSLAAHFIILLCIYACISKSTARSMRKNIVIWGGLLCLSAGIHLYFVPMVGIFMIFYMLDDYIQTKKALPPLIVSCVSFMFLVLTMFVFGAFYSHADPTAGNLRHASANMNSLFNPQGTSKYLKDLPLATDGQYEGYSYIGLGMILGLLIILVLCSKKIQSNRKLFYDTDLSRKIILTTGVLLSLFLFALSPKITINSHVVFEYYIPVVNTIWSIFQSTGRMMWPVVYIVMCFVLWRIKKEYCSKTAIVILVVLFVIQYRDLHDYFKMKGSGFKNKTEWQNELRSNAWAKLAPQYRYIFFLQDTKTKLYSFHDIALKHGMAVNDSYLARKNLRQIEQYKEDEKVRIHSGDARGDTIYVFSTTEEAALFAKNLHLYIIDNVIIGLKEKQDYLQ
ncbi:MAG: DUF6311 domain-containing protein [Spirochaetaceae bacterium]|nr:DUF6311 domain-containing protein [Spirochaetaceae bacterium]